MKEEVVMNEVKLAAPSPLSKEEKSIISKLITETAHMCSIFDVDFRRLAKKHENGVKEDMRKGERCSVQ